MTPRVLYSFWVGPPQMSAARQACLEDLRKTCGVKHVLVTEENLPEFLVAPLHPGFESLSAVHRSDYLRSYFMFHHGGGYSDVKKSGFDWSPYFDQLDQSDCQFIGCQEQHPSGIAVAALKPLYLNFVGNNHFIFKPSTSFAKRWYEAVQKRMDEALPMLLKHPGDYHPRAVKGGTHDLLGKSSRKPTQAELEKYPYPLEWNEIHGRIFHKLQHEHLGVYLKTLPATVNWGYR